jgi:hypothetical protein
MKDIILDTLIDSLKLLPFLFVAFLIIEFLEHKLSNKNRNIISKSGKIGPIFGSILGLFPQCGFSVMATNLYVTRTITMGTLISIYLSTSDEMLPILLSQNVSFTIIFRILFFKFLIGMLSGIIIDFIIRKKNKNNNVTLENYDICDSEGCHCEESIVLSSLIHTLKTFLFIMIITFILNTLMTVIGEGNLAKLFLKNSIFSSFVASLVGLIPNCVASVMLTELYLKGLISFGAVISGLLTGSGVAIILLFKENKKIKENIIILSCIYGIGVISGIIITLLEMLF